MAGYDANKDKLISETPLMNGTMRLATFTYNDGEEKSVIQERSVKINKADGSTIESWINIKGRMNSIDFKVLIDDVYKVLNSAK